MWLLLKIRMIMRMIVMQVRLRTQMLVLILAALMNDECTGLV